MSENVMSNGFVAVLKTPINAADYEEKSEWLWEQNTNLHINYEGTIVYSDNRSDGYGLTIITGNAVVNNSAFVEECKNLGLDIEPDTICSYNCYWYNGSDPDMALLTLEEFKEKTNHTDES